MGDVEHGKGDGSDVEFTLDQASVPSRKNAKIITILSIDGGGVRGIIPTVILDRIEQLTQTPISRLFDVIAGTSTGGLIALGLTKEGDQKSQPAYMASDILKIYREKI